MQVNKVRVWIGCMVRDLQGLQSPLEPLRIDRFIRECPPAEPDRPSEPVRTGPLSLRHAMILNKIVTQWTTMLTTRQAPAHQAQGDRESL